MMLPLPLVLLCCCCCCCYCCRHCAARQMESTLHLQHTFHSIHRFQRDNYVLLCSPHKNTLFFRACQSTASTIYHLLCFQLEKTSSSAWYNKPLNLFDATNAKFFDMKNSHFMGIFQIFYIQMGLNRDDCSNLGSNHLRPTFFTVSIQFETKEIYQFYAMFLHNRTAFLCVKEE